MESKVIGTTMPVLEVKLEDGEEIISESGELSWMSSSITLQTSTKAGAPTGAFGRLKRMVGGGGLFMTEYIARGGAGIVAFATKMPGQIFPVQVEPGRGYMAHRHGFLCGTSGIQVSVGFQQSLGAGIFGGEGFLLQRVEGQAQAWIELDGEVVVYELAPGETLRVHPGHVGLFEESVGFNITTVPGIKNKLFGGRWVLSGRPDWPWESMVAVTSNTESCTCSRTLHRTGTTGWRRRYWRRYRRRRAGWSLGRDLEPIDL